MLVKCPACGSHCPVETAVEVESEAGPRRYCSSRCAERSEPRAPQPGAGLPPLPRRILVAVDGSGPSLRAVERAAGLARASGGSVVLLHAVDDRLLRAFDLLAGAQRAIDFQLGPAEVERMLREDAALQLERPARVCREAGVACETRIELVPALEAILAAAEQADLIVIGSRGRGALSGAVLGSVSQRVIGAARRPVLVVQ